MSKSMQYEVIIVGGSFAGLSAAMTLGRSLRSVLVIDDGLPCNRQAPYSHNLIAHDGEKPMDIAAKAKTQVLNYPNVTWLQNKIIEVHPIEGGFIVKTEQNSFETLKVLFTTGIKDIMPDINGFAECWGISIIHCPYCHGYEVRDSAIGILGNGITGFQFSKFLKQWSKNLVLLCNGPAGLDIDHKQYLDQHNVRIIETEIKEIIHENGSMSGVLFSDGTILNIKSIFTRPAFEQHCKIPHDLGCELTDHGLLRVDQHQKTNVAGILAAGDNSHFFRSVSVAIAAGTIAGATINRELIQESP